MRVLHIYTLCIRGSRGGTDPPLENSNLLLVIEFSSPKIDLAPPPTNTIFWIRANYLLSTRCTQTLIIISSLRHADTFKTFIATTFSHKYAH